MRTAPWLMPKEAIPGDAYECPRCHEEVPEYHRHFWPGCRFCATLNVLAQNVLGMLGLDVHEWLYEYPAQDCPWCDGSGYAACVLQDMSVLRHRGVCGVCGLPAWDLVRIYPVAEAGLIEDSARHDDGEDRGHEVVVVPGPMADVINRQLDEGTQWFRDMIEEGSR